MSVEYERLEIPMDLELKWVKTKLHERDKHILKLAEENSKLREDLREDLREGISLRDHFAGLAMQGVMAMDDDIDYKYTSSVAYRMADAMLEEREKKK
jgi:hypothetical protein